MLQSVSWNEYGVILLVSLLLYYVYVGYKYYLWELLGIVGIKKADDNISKVSVEDYRTKLGVENDEDYLPKTLSPYPEQPVRDEIKAYLDSTADAVPSKDELQSVFRMILSKYPRPIPLENSKRLQEFILSETNQVHEGIFSVTDVEMILSF
jgi:hypothetical protein